MRNSKNSFAGWKYILLAAFLLVQSLAVTHVIDHGPQETQEEICILCQNSDDTPITAGIISWDNSGYIPSQIEPHILTTTPLNAYFGIDAIRAPPSFQI